MVVYGTYLSRDCAFFKAALKKQWSEGQSRVIKPPEDTPLHMEYYIEHMYGGKLPTHTLQSERKQTYSKPSHLELLASLYVLGERMLDPKYQNTIIHELLRLIHHHSGFGGSYTSFPGTKTMNIIYQRTTAGSPARRMMVDFVTNSRNEG
jgi:hypothetical protein